MARRMRKTGSGIGGSSSSDDGIANDVATASDAGSSDGGNSESVGATVDPETITAAGTGDGDGNDQPVRRRGRPKGSSNSSKAKPLPLNVSGLEKLLVGLHGGMAMLSGRMEWMLDTGTKAFDGMTEAEFLAKSIKDVADHYGHGMFDQKTLDWANLTQCLLIVYGGRLFAIRSTPRAPKPQQRSNAAPRPHFETSPMSASPTHSTPVPRNDFGEPNPNAVIIPGVGMVELPDDDPRSPNYKPKYN